MFAKCPPPWILFILFDKVIIKLKNDEYQDFILSFYWFYFFFLNAYFSSAYFFRFYYWNLFDFWEGEGEGEGKGEGCILSLLSVLFFLYFELDFYTDLDFDLETLLFDFFDIEESLDWSNSYLYPLVYFYGLFLPRFLT